MKKGIVFLLLACTSLGHSQTVEEIIANHITANGGFEKITSIKTLQYSTSTKLNMMGRQMDLNSSTFIENNKLYRKEIDGMMGMKSSYTLITDTVGYISTPSIRGFGDFPGIEGGIKKMDSADYRTASLKLDISQEFSPLIKYNYTKGYHFELLGKSKVDKVDCYKIKVTAEDAEISLFYIDASTFLTKQLEVSGKQMSAILGLRGVPMGDMMGGRMDKQKILIIYKEYADLNGIKFPSKQIIQLGANDIEIDNNNIEINEMIAPQWYKAN